jgi:hypothetical protein
MMNTHKIRNVAKDICAAEQKIAYNIAFNLHLAYSDKWKKLETAAARSEFRAALVSQGLENYRLSYDYKPDKFNEDAIFCALNAGLENYFNKFFIASDYETIGKAFPIYY